MSEAAQARQDFDFPLTAIGEYTFQNSVWERSDAKRNCLVANDIFMFL